MKKENVTLIKKKYLCQHKTILQNHPIFPSRHFHKHPWGLFHVSLFFVFLLFFSVSLELGNLVVNWSPDELVRGHVVFDLG